MVYVIHSWQKRVYYTYYALCMYMIVKKKCFEILRWKADGYKVMSSGQRPHPQVQSLRVWALGQWTYRAVLHISAHCSLWSVLSFLVGCERLLFFYQQFDALKKIWNFKSFFSFSVKKKKKRFEPRPWGLLRQALSYTPDLLFCFILFYFILCSTGV
jgi:hypothetical protein